MAANHQPPTPIEVITADISPDDQSISYDVIFYEDTINTIITCNPIVASQWISEVEFIHRQDSPNLIVGLDVKWRQSFTRHINNPAATLQLCVGRRCLIFQLMHSPHIPSAILGFLANPNYAFVGIGIHAALEKLQDDYTIRFNTNAVDLSEWVADAYGRRDLRTAGLESLASVVLDKEVEMPRHIALSDWGVEWLSPLQIGYASIDAFISLEIGCVMEVEAPAFLPSSFAFPY